MQVLLLLWLLKVKMQNMQNSFEICVLASGSKGNATLVTNGKSSFLIDCGLNASCLKTRLRDIGKSIKDIDFAILTHEHSDHTKGTLALANTYDIPIYAHDKTLKAMCRSTRFETKNLAKFVGFGGFSKMGFDIFPFFNHHDVFTVGYLICFDNKKFLYSTDLGKVTDEFFDLANGANLVMLESNYDIDMLKNGIYPPYLKQRIASQNGHLSNVDCANTLTKLINMGIKTFVLAHLSEENNTPKIALNETEAALLSIGAKRDKDYFVTVAKQHENSNVIMLV